MLVNDSYEGQKREVKVLPGEFAPQKIKINEILPSLSPDVLTVLSSSLTANS